MSTAFFRNKFVDDKEVLIKPNNRAFKYGDGCFESIRIINGAPAFWDVHLERLRKTLKTIHINLQSDDFWWGSTILKLLEVNRVKDGLMRIQVYRDGGGKYAPEINEGVVLISLSSVTQTTYPMPPIHKEAMVFQELLLPKHDLGNLKLLNKSLHIVAADVARINAVDEAIILNEEQAVAEAISSNVFAVVDDEVYTPPLSDGGLNGVIRRIILDNTSELELPIIKERSLQLDDLRRANEIWTTNSSTGISVINHLGGKKYSNTLAHKTQARLNTLAINSCLDFQERWT